MRLKITPETLAEAAFRHFHEDLKASILNRLREEIEPELEQIAKEVAMAVCDVAVEHYRDFSTFETWHHVRFKINGEEYKPSR